MLSNEQIRLIQNYFSGQAVLRAYLFGSHARNQANEESDIDLLVELDYSQIIGWHFVQMKLDLEKLLQQPVDLVSANGISKYIRPIVDKEKIEIYAKQIGW